MLREIFLAGLAGSILTVSYSSVAVETASAESVSFNCDADSERTSSIELNFANPIETINFDFRFKRRLEVENAQIPFVAISFGSKPWDGNFSNSVIVLWSQPLVFSDNKFPPPSTMAGGRHVASSANDFVKVILDEKKSKDIKDQGELDNGDVKIILKDQEAIVVSDFGPLTDLSTSLAIDTSNRKKVSIICYYGEYDFKDIRVETKPAK